MGRGLYGAEQCGQGGGPSFGYFLRLGRSLRDAFGQRAFRGVSADTMSAILKEEPAELWKAGRLCLQRWNAWSALRGEEPGAAFSVSGDLAFNLESLTDGARRAERAGRRRLRMEARSHDSTEEGCCRRANGEHWRAHWRWRL